MKKKVPAGKKGKGLRKLPKSQKQNGIYEERWKGKINGKTLS